jgi:hypothetical protein
MLEVKADHAAAGQLELEGILPIHSEILKRLVADPFTEGRDPHKEQATALLYHFPERFNGGDQAASRVKPHDIPMAFAFGFLDGIEFEGVMKL